MLNPILWNTYLASVNIFEITRNMVTLGYIDPNIQIILYNGCSFESRYANLLTMNKFSGDSFTCSFAGPVILNDASLYT